MDIKERLIEWLFGAAGGIAILSKFIIELLKIRQRKMIAKFAKKHKKVAQNIERVYQLMQQVTQLETVDSILIMKFHNGGKLPSVDRPVFLTAMYEDADRTNVSSKHHYHSTEADAAYMRVLHELIEQKQLKKSITDLQNGLMKSNWLGLGVKYARLFWLHTNKERTAFVIIKTSTDSKLDSAKENATILSSIQELKQIFRN